MADASLTTVINVQLRTKGAKASANQVTTVATALQKAGKSVEQFEAELLRLQKMPRAISALSDASQFLYKNLANSGEAANMSADGARRYARELANVHNECLRVIQSLGYSEKEANKVALIMTWLTSQTKRFTDRTNQLVPAVQGETLVFNEQCKALTEVLALFKAVSAENGETVISEERLTTALGTTNLTLRQKIRNALKSADTLSNLNKITNTLTATFKRCASALRQMSTVINRSNSVVNKAAVAFRRTYSMMRAILFTGLIFGGLFKSWFELSAGFAEVNHMLYTVNASLYDGARSVSILTDGTIKFAEAIKVVDEETGKVVKEITELAGTEEDLKHLVTATDMFGNQLSDALYYDNAETAKSFQDVIDYLDEIAYKMELDPTNLKQTYAQFLGMAQSAGMATDHANALALSMTELTYDLASLWDVPFETAAQRMRSALAGITRAVQQFGLDVSKASMDAWLLKHGIDASYNSLSRADKMMAIYLKMMENTDAAQGDLARSALQPANMFRFLKEQAGLAARQLGGAIFPIMTAIIPLFIRAAQAVQAFAASLRGWLGVHLGKWYNDAVEDWNSYLSNLGMNNNQPWLEDLDEDLEDTAAGFGSASDAAKDFKKQLLGFDEINNLTETEKGGSGGGGGIGGIDWDAYNFDFDDIWGRWDDNVRVQIEAAADIIYDVIHKALVKAFGETTVARVEIWWDRFKRVLAGDKSLERYLEKTFGINVDPILEDLKQKWDNIRSFFSADGGEMFAKFIRTLLRIIGFLQDMGDLAIEAFEWILTEIDKVPDEDIQKFLDGLARGFRDVWEVIRDHVIPMIERLIDILGDGDAGTLGERVAKFGAFFAIFNGLAPILQPVLTVLGGIVKAVMALLTLKLPSWLTKLLGAKTVGGGVVKGIATGVSKAVKSIGLAGANIIGKGAGGTLLKSIGTTLGEVAGPIAATLAAVAGIGYGTYKAAGYSQSKLGVGFTGFDPTDPGAALRMAGNLKGLEGMYEGTLNGMSESMTSFAQDMYDSWEEMSTHPELYALSMKDAFRDCWDSEQELQANTSRVFGGINTIIGNSKQSMLDYAAATSTSGGVATESANALAQSVTGKFNEITASASDTVNGVNNSFKTFLNENTLYSQMMNVGSQTIKGFKQGVSNEAWNLSSWFNSNFGNMINNIKAKLDIHSPSGVMAEIGEYFMEGFNVGVSDELPTVLGTLNSFVADAVTTMKMGAIETSDLTKSITPSITTQANIALTNQNNDLMTASQIEIGLLREQNGLLAQLLEKEFGVSLDGNMLAASINKASRVQGRPLVWA